MSLFRTRKTALCPLSAFPTFRIQLTHPYPLITLRYRVIMVGY